MAERLEVVWDGTVGCAHAEKILEEAKKLETVKAGLTRLGQDISFGTFQDLGFRKEYM